MNRSSSALLVGFIAFSVVIVGADPPRSVTFLSGHPTVGQVWSHTAESSQQMTLTLSDGENVFREMQVGDSQRRTARIEVLRVADGRPDRLHIQVREAWRQEGDESARVSSPAEGQSYIAQRGSGSPSLLRADGKRPDETEKSLATKLSDDLLGEGAASPEEALFELVAGTTIPIGQVFEPEDERAKLIFIGMPVEQAAEWQVDEARLELAGLRAIAGAECGLFAVRFAGVRRTTVRTTRLRLDGEICVATENGRWLDSRLGGPTEMIQPFDPRNEKLEVKGEGQSSTQTTWRLVGDTRKRRG